MILRIMICFLSTFVANGLARFGYVVLIPIMIISGRLNENQSIQLGIAVLVGYIFGSFFINFLRKFISLENIAKLSFLIISLSFFACMMESLPFIWAWLWRFFAGVASASLMILAAPLSLPYVKERFRGRIGGFVFSGIGLGAVVSGFTLPFIANINIDLVWIVLGGVVFCAFILSLFSLRTLKRSKQTIHKDNKFKIPYGLWLLIISYILNAIGYLPHTLFWVDYLVRDLKFSTLLAGSSWAFFGIGAVLGSIGSGILADRIGIKNAHIVILFFKALSCFIAAFASDLFWLNFSIFVMGFTTTGNVTLTNALALKIVSKKHFPTSSSFLTLAFGIFQAIFSFLFAYLLKFLDGYFWMFIFCGFCLIFSFLVLLPIKISTLRN
ncbi:YbfB/YjiJ family MFS transporter [Campylobacter coli]|uniref:YbfB/YjiJ family MFS transporter n=1 Tax=Campylobacter coli TaxID=195 RepID=UPI000257CC31|nr:YbfB/YjiJ family MFS transporter [Campylobacter coli]EAI3388303.1 YbfB/YjiJ family MFS transporter [Campylobacter jejuni]EIA82169.1 nitrite extrusion protein [Campylobacter coli 59-2]EAI6361530.1 YbfB/YjiJ family MFS transporter [Campylobacter coli]EAK8022827.1 YbfB/YjiJ family MFS transporter [Campylobacter coli]EDO8878414.1 YbfB/YjiJ family MFS transporter [Campylobacter coli]